MGQHMHCLKDRIARSAASSSALKLVSALRLAPLGTPWQRCCLADESKLDVVLGLQMSISVDRWVFLETN